MRKLTFFLTIMSCLVLNAQIPSSWSIDFEGDVKWQRVTPLGNLIVHASGSLIGINTETGEKLWQLDNLGAVSESSYGEVGKSEFFTVASSKSGNQIRLINSLTGAVLMNSQNEGIETILSNHLIGKQNLLLLVVKKSGQDGASLISFDINSNSIKWTNDELFKIEAVSLGNSKLAGLLGDAATKLGNEANAAALLDEPFALSENSLLLLHPNYAYCIDPNSGDEKWKYLLKGALRASAEMSEKQPGTVYVSTETERESSSGFSSYSSSSSSRSSEPAPPPSEFKLAALDMESGSPKWDKPYKSQGSLSTLIFDDGGIIVTPLQGASKTKINLVDYATGQGKWGKKGKGEKFKGSIVKFFPLDGNYVITTAYDNAWSNQAEEYYINVLDPSTGFQKFEKSEKLKGDLRSVQLLDKGVLYITSKEINILNLSSGENYFKSIEAGNPLDPSKYDPRKHGVSFTQNDDKVYAFSSKTSSLYEIDKNSATSKALTEKIKFEGKETPYNLELKDDGIILSSEQNIMKVRYDGSTIYQSYFPAPREPAILRAMAAAEGLRAAYIGAAAAAYSEAFQQAANQSDDQLGQEVGQGLSDGFAELSQQGFAYSKSAMGYAKARFKASAATQEFMFILTDLGKRQFALVQVNKADGKQLAMIDLGKDKDPNYEIDQIYNQVYYNSEPDKIVCYKFQ